MNRAAKKSRLFDNNSDYRAFLEIVSEAVTRFGVVFFSYIVMPNHWHFLLSSGVDRNLSRFMHWLEVTHARRWALAKGLDGQGAVYQGRFKAIAIQTERHFMWVCRYVERNALRANLVHRAEDWRWSSLWQRHNAGAGPLLADWPVSKPDEWIRHVNTPQTDAELEAFRHALRRGQPFGDADWLTAIGQKLPRPRGRPRGCPEKMTPDPI
jgi:REP-associated tyrosine transposase